VVNDEQATRAVVAAFERRFGADRVVEQPQPAAASEDFSAIGAALGVPSVYWFVGGVDPAVFAAAEKARTLDELPSNHAPNFAPVIEPTLRTGVETLLTAAGVWLGADPQS
jgi:metal-dependent amidase/aminoacylase/carboxypeptidase family protein